MNQTTLAKRAPLWQNERLAPKTSEELMQTMKFELSQLVVLAESAEEGHVVGRAEYSDATYNYLVRYKNAVGVQVEEWWAESALLLPGTPTSLPF